MEASACYAKRDEEEREVSLLADYMTAIGRLQKLMQPFIDTLDGVAVHAGNWRL